MNIRELYPLLRNEQIIDAEIELIFANTKLQVPRFLGVMRAAKASSNVLGATAEVGCSSGGTSLLIARLCGRMHFACDTFNGLQDVSAADGRLKNGMFRGAAKTQVEEILRDYKSRVVEGYFPDCSPLEMRDSKFSLVHIDVDTYKSTRACIDFFWDRMSNGGVMVLDDVVGTVGRLGAWKAWDETKKKPGIKVIETNQSQIIIRRSAL